MVIANTSNKHPTNLTIFSLIPLTTNLTRPIVNLATDAIDELTSTIKFLTGSM